MSDPIEDRLRSHFAGKTANVDAQPDLSAFTEHSAGASGRRRPLAIGAVALAVVVAGSGVLTGFELAGGSNVASPRSAPPKTVPGRAGASLAPGAYGGPASIAQMPYRVLFNRTTSSGVTIRAYGSGAGTTGGCTPTAPCPLVPGPTPCPKGVMCSQPRVTPQAQTTTGGSAGVSSGSATATPQTLPPQPGSGTTGTGPTGSGTTGSGTTGTVPTGTVPTQPGAGCGGLVIELSTDRAVGSASVTRPTTAAPTPTTAVILGTGSFGTEEGGPVGWVAVWVGTGVASVQLSSGGAVVDTMAPADGLVVLAAPGNPGLSGATVVGVDQSGATVASVPADQSSGPGVSTYCVVPPGPPSSTTTTTPTTQPTSTTTTTPSTTTTTMPPSSTTPPPTTTQPTPTNKSGPPPSAG